MRERKNGIFLEFQNVIIGNSSSYNKKKSLCLTGNEDKSFQNRLTAH